MIIFYNISAVFEGIVTKMFLLTQIYVGLNWNIPGVIDPTKQKASKILSGLFC